MIYSSRSRVETFQECQRRGYINYLWDGRGLQKRACSVYLSTGLYLHVGLEYIFRWVMLNLLLVNQEVVDYAVNLAISDYWKEVTERGFDLEDGENKENEKFVLYEQCALVEAFIRSFALRVLPDLLQRFRIVEVEREEFYTQDNITIEGRLDVILEEISTSDIYIISFKSAANWDKRQQKANEHDNQGLSETWLLENRMREENNIISSILNPVVFNNSLLKLDPKVVKAIDKFRDYVDKFRKKDKVMGVIMIYFLKGKRYESYSRPGLWEQHSPLIRGYRKLVGTQYEYAGSLYYDNPSNKSGKGKLGKGWESFNVWESEEVGFIKGWIHMANDNNLGQDIIGDSFKIPAPYFRNQNHLDDWFEQHIAEEENIQENLEVITLDEDRQELRKVLNKTFRQTRKHCHYPNDCQFLDICYNQEIFDDPIGSGKFIYRKPHHEREKEEHERLYRISEVMQGDTRDKSSNGGGNGVVTNNNNAVVEENIQIDEVVDQ